MKPEKVVETGDAGGGGGSLVESVEQAMAGEMWLLDSSTPRKKGERKTRRLAAESPDLEQWVVERLRVKKDRQESLGRAVVEAGSGCRRRSRLSAKVWERFYNRGRKRSAFSSKTMYEAG